MPLEGAARRWSRRARRRPAPGPFVHCDYAVSGVQDMLTTWLPLMDIPPVLGGLAIRPGSIRPVAAAAPARRGRTALGDRALSPGRRPALSLPDPARGAAEQRDRAPAFRRFPLAAAGPAGASGAHPRPRAGPGRDARRAPPRMGSRTRSRSGPRAGDVQPPAGSPGVVGARPGRARPVPAGPADRPPAGTVTVLRRSPGLAAVPRTAARRNALNVSHPGPPWPAATRPGRTA